MATTVAVRNGRLLPQDSAQGIGALTSGTHVVSVAVTRSATVGVVVTVYLDQVRVLQLREPSLTRMVRLAFTAGTGTATDRQIVRSVAISAES